MSVILILLMFQIVSNILKLHGAANSMQGGRRENQDDLGFIDTPLGFLFIVCDGMGGGPGGKTASAIAKQEIARYINSCNQLTPRKQALRAAVAKANDALTAAMAANKELQGMGTTVVAILVNGESAIVCHAGDSRCYRLHGRFMLFRTQDHSLVGELVRKKVLTEEEARTSPQSNVIAKSLGSKTDHNPDIEEMGYRKGDRFILCTDGIWGSMPHKKLMALFSAKGNPAAVVGRISSEVERAGLLKGGGHDNHTVAMIVMDCNSKMHDRWYRLMWGILGGVFALLLTVVIACCIALGSGKSEQTASVADEGGPVAAGGTVSPVKVASKDGSNTLPGQDLLEPSADEDSEKKADQTEASADKSGNDGNSGSGGKTAADDKSAAGAKTDTNGKENSDGTAKDENRKQASPEQFKASVQQALDALNKMVTYHNADKEKTAKEKKLHADNVIKALKKVEQNASGKDLEKSRSILAYAERNKSAMAGVGRGKEDKTFGSSGSAKGILDTIKKKLDELKKK